MIAKKKAKPSFDLYIAAIGASAGGLEALQQLISHIPSEIKNIAFIVVQHLSPTYKSMLVQTLRSHTKLEVVEVRNKMTVSACHIYITPPDCEVSVKNGILFLNKAKGSNTPHPSIDGLFSSLAADRKQKAIGVILSGTGADGAIGIQAIKDAGGIILVQNPKTAKYNGMPTAAIATGVVDFVLGPDKIAEQITQITTGRKQKATHYSKKQIKEHNYKEVIALLSSETGTDFTNYKQNTLYRRIDKRMAELKLDSVEKYIKYIAKNQAEFEALFSNFLIGVTNFFRDAAVFKTLEKHLSALIDAKEENAPIRVWVPGCSTGEEAFTVAMIIADILKKKKRIFPVQVFGTDIDENALVTARKAIYSNKAMLHVPAEKAKDYFIKHNGYAEVSKPIRGMVLFSRHDLTHNPPFLKLDVIICRNLLIYFNNRLQDYIFPVFFSALKPHGYLLLGKSEGIGHFTDLFTMVHSTAKIYQRKGGMPLHNIRYTPLKTEEAFKHKIPPYDFSVTEMVKETLYRVFEHPYVVINDNADIKEISGDVSPYLGLKQGQMNANLFKLAHADLKIELRSLVNKCVKENKDARGNLRKLQISDKEHGVKITVRPLLYAESPNEYYLVVFESIKSESGEKAKPVTTGSTGSLNRIKELELELDATKEDLQNFVERLENTNAELQTVNEEAQSTNEELRISNEELETTNEELQSSNEEINIAYAELKTAHLDLEKQEQLLRKSETNIQALLNNTMQSFVMIDQDYKIIAFNEQAVKTFRAISGIKLLVGDNFEQLILRKEFAAFVVDFKQALRGKPILAERNLVDKQGKIKTYITNFIQVMEGHQARGISFSMMEITELVKTRAELQSREELLASVFDTADIGIAVIDMAGKIVRANEGLYKLLGYHDNELSGKYLYKFIATDDQIKIKHTHAELLNGKNVNFECKAILKDRSTINIYITSKAFKRSDGSKFIIKTVRDITESTKYKELLHQAEKITKIGGFEIDTATNKMMWTEEMYHIHEVGLDYIPTMKGVAKFYSKETAIQIKQMVHDAMVNGVKYDRTLQLVTADKTIKWIRVMGTPVILKSKIIKLIGTIQDITHQKQSEEEILRLSYVARHTNNAVIITDAHGLIVWINKSFEKLTGYNLDELMGKVPGHILQGIGTDKAAIKRISERLKKQQGSTGEILLNYTKKGDPVWISMDITPIFKDGELINYVGIMTDLTDLINARDLQKKQEVLLQKQELFNSIARYFPNGIIGIINRDLKYVFVGGTELSKLNLNHHELIGDYIFDKMHSGSNEFAAPFLKRAFMDEKVSFEISISGNIYLVVAVPIKEKEAPINQALVVIYNITPQKNTEEELLRAVEQQKELNELKSKFVSIASHEFRTPLSTILSSSFLLEKYNNTLDATKREKHLTRIKKSVNNLIDILNDFLTLGKIEEGGLRNNPSLFNMRAFFKDIMDVMKPNLKPGQEIRFRHTGDGDMVNLDEQHLHNIMLNLLSNAIKYSPESKVIYLTSVSKSTVLEVTVRDHGIGIPVEDQKRLFNTFYRAHNVINIPGTGMGLHIVKKYLDIMGGTISFTSQVNKGSLFTIRIKQGSVNRATGS